MTQLDVESVQAKLEKLAAAIDVLDEIKGMEKELFLRDVMANGAAMFNLVIGIELIVDIGNHILNAAFNKPLQAYKEVLKELGKREVVPTEFAEKNIKMADFRNQLIHAYPDVNLEEVHEHLQKAPDIFREFARCFQEFMEGDKK